MQTFTALSDGKTTFSLMPKGVREYEDIGKDHQVIRLTIFRTYGRLGKKDLVLRPGRASGDETVATPDAELHRKLKFDFGISIINSSFSESHVAEIAKRYNTALRVYSYAEFLNGRLIFPFNKKHRNLEEKQSMLSGQGNLILSTIKKAEERPGYVIRLYNPNFKAEDEELIFTKKLKQVELVNLKEEKVEDLSINPENNSVKISAVKHNKIVNVYFDFNF